MTFVLKYPEHNGRSDGADPWSIRQTGVYQSFDPLTTTSLWMLLNPRRNAAADTRIRGMLNGPEGYPQLHEQPPLIGLVVLSTYFANWRTYMEFYEEEELKMVTMYHCLNIRCPIITSFSVSSCYRSRHRREAQLQPLHAISTSADRGPTLAITINL